MSTSDPVVHVASWVPVDLPGATGGQRAAAYDMSRDCLWIATRVFAQTGDYMKLTRVNLSDHSVVETGVQLDASDWNGAWVAVDDADQVWVAVGKSLYRYAPDANSVTRFNMPAFGRFGVHPSLYSGDGRMIAFSRDPSGEMWMAYQKVAAIFGFNPALGKWDRVVRLPWFPAFYSQLTTLRPGVLLVNGYRTPDDKHFYTRFAAVDMTTGALKHYDAEVEQYVLADAKTVLFTNLAGDLGRLDLDTGAVTILDGETGANLAAAGRAAGSKSIVWYGMSTGIGNVDVETGIMSRFDYPLVVPIKPVPNVCNYGPHGLGPCTYPCPTGVKSCVLKPFVPAAPVTSLMFDKNGNIWVVTDSGGQVAYDQPDYRQDPPLLAIMEFELAGPK